VLLVSPPLSPQDEEENVLGSILAELGVEIGNKMAAPGSGAVPSASAGAAVGEPAGVSASGGAGGGEDLDAELQRRLDSLRRT